MKFLQSCDERCWPWWWQGQRCSSQEAGAPGCGGASSPTSRPPPGRCRWNKETILVSWFKFFPIVCQHSYWRTYWKTSSRSFFWFTSTFQSVKCSVSSHILFVCPNSMSLITVEIINQPPISKVVYSYKSFILRMGGVVWPGTFEIMRLPKKRAMLTFSGGVDKVFKEQPGVTSHQKLN